MSSQDQTGRLSSDAGVHGNKTAAAGERRSAPTALLGIYALTVCVALISPFVGVAPEMRDILVVIFPAQTALLAHCRGMRG
jgi:hypothetical protein